MAIMKVATLDRLGEFLAECRSVFAAITHKHKMSDLEDYTIIDNCESTNANAPLSANQGTILKNEIEEINGILADLLYEPIAFTSFTNNVGTVELGSTVNSVTLTWATNKTPATLTLDGTSIDVSLKSHTYSGLALKPTSVTTKTYTIAATDDRNASASKTTSFSFVNGVYYGVINSGATVDSAAIRGMTRKLQNSKAMSSFTVNAGAGQHIVYALPSRLGTPSMSVGGFSGGFNLIQTFNFTNASGYTESYDVWRSTNDNLGKTTVVVS